MHVHVVPPAGKPLETKSPEHLKDELFAFQAPFLEEKMLRDGAFRTPEEFHKAFTELKKYFWMNALAQRQYAMTSRSVDEVWHQFILFTMEYHEFCDRFFGHYLHHSPNRSDTPTPDDAALVKGFFQEYQRHFGTVPRLWLEHLAGNNGATTFVDALAWGSLAAALQPYPRRAT